MLLLLLFFDTAADASANVLCWQIELSIKLMEWERKSEGRKREGKQNNNNNHNHHNKKRKVTNISSSIATRERLIPFVVAWLVIS